MGTTPEPFDALGGADTTVDAETPASPVAPAQPTEPSVLDRVRTTLAGTTARRVVGWGLVVGWVVWLAALWVSQPRLVPEGFLADDLAQGRITRYSVVTVEVNNGGILSGGGRIEITPANDADDGDIDVADDGLQLTVAYWVDAPVADLRVVDTNGLWSDVPAAQVERLDSAGVPEAGAGDLFFRPPAQRAYTAGSLLMALTFLMAVLGPRPTRGTRWFWFWLLGAPLGLAVPLFAVAERLRPRSWPEGTVHPSGVAGRWTGLTGVAMGFVLSLVTTGVYQVLAGISPIWFIRG